MLKFLLPLGLTAIGVGGGIGAGVMLRPDVSTTAAESGQHQAATTGDSGHAEQQKDQGGDHDDGHGAGDAVEFVKLNNQFVIPVLAAERVESLVVMSLSIETAAGNSEVIYQREPKLRDSFLQVLFDHANMGGFRGGFTDTARLDVLRAALLEAARSVLGPEIGNVLITDIARQDV